MNTLFSALWESNQQQLLRMLDKLTPENITNRIKPEMRSVGLILLHTAEVQFMLAGTLFGVEPPAFQPKTLSKTTENTDITNVEELRSFVKASSELMAKGIAAADETAWNMLIPTPFKTEMHRAILLGFAMNHTMQHVGQVIQALKYGA